MRKKMLELWTAVSGLVGLHVMGNHSNLYVNPRINRFNGANW